MLFFFFPCLFLLLCSVLGRGFKIATEFLVKVKSINKLEIFCFLLALFPKLFLNIVFGSPIGNFLLRLIFKARENDLTLNINPCGR